MVGREKGRRELVLLQGWQLGVRPRDEKQEVRLVHGVARSASRNATLEMEGRLLRLVLEEGADIPSQVLEHLTLEPHHLGQASPEQLLVLAGLLDNLDNDRSADGARVALLCLDPSSEEARAAI